MTIRILRADAEPSSSQPHPSPSVGTAVETPVAAQETAAPDPQTQPLSSEDAPIAGAAPIPTDVPGAEPNVCAEEAAASPETVEGGEESQTPPGEPEQQYGKLLYGLLGRIVEAADPTTEADPVGVLCSLISAVGALVGPGPHVMVGNTRHPLLIWPLLVGPTARGRKGEATSTAMRFVEAADPEYKSIVVSGLSSGEGLIERIKDRTDAGDGTKSRAPRDWEGTDDKRLLVIEPEFVTVMTRMRREGNTVSAVLREAWEGRSLAVLTKQQVVASASHVAVIGHITPKEFKARINTQDAAGGTYNRFLPISVTRSKRLPMPAGIDPEVLHRLGLELRQTKDRARALGRITLSGAAESVWKERLYDEFTDFGDEDSQWADFVQRAAPHVLRIAALYAALEGREEISEEDLFAAATLVRYSMDSVRSMLGNETRDSRLGRIRQAIDDAPEGVSRTEVSRLLGGGVTAKGIDDLMTEVLADPHYVQEAQATGGRPSLVYRRTGLLSSSASQQEAVHSEAAQEGTDG